MRHLEVCFLLLVVLSTASVACEPHDTSSDDTTSDGGGGGGASVLTHCGIYAVDDVCDPCLHQECCDELAACGAAGNRCISCVYSGVGDSPECVATKDLALAVILCSYNRCRDTCFYDTYNRSSSSSGS